MTLMTLMTFLCDNNYSGAVHALTAASSGGLSKKRGRTLYFTFSAAHMYLRRYHAAVMQQAGRSCARKNDLRKKKSDSLTGPATSTASSLYLLSHLSLPFPHHPFFAYFSTLRFIHQLYMSSGKSNTIALYHFPPISYLKFPHTARSDMLLRSKKDSTSPFPSDTPSALSAANLHPSRAPPFHSFQHIPAAASLSLRLKRRGFLPPAAPRWSSC